MTIKSITEFKVSFSFGPWRGESSAVNFDGSIKFEMPPGTHCLAIHQARMTLDEAIEAGYFEDEEE